MFEIEYYETDNGKIPVYDFIAKQQCSGVPDHNLWLCDGSGSYFFVKDNKIILTNGYIKKQNKMDTNEFEKAVKYKEDYERREKRWILKNI